MIWTSKLGLAYGTNVCYRCGRKLKDGEEVRTGSYRPMAEWYAGLRWRVYHVDMNCEAVNDDSE